LGLGIRKAADKEQDGVLLWRRLSGKSLSMVFFAGKPVLAETMNTPTLVVLTDRNDLDQ
jgi:type I restriction enzyme R subunit